MTQAEIGKRIAEERKAQGLSIRQLAKMCEISTTTLQGVEKGWFDGKISTYLKIAETLGLEMAIFEITIPQFWHLSQLVTNYTKNKKETLTSQLWGSFVEFI